MPRQIDPATFDRRLDGLPAQEQEVQDVNRIGDVEGAIVIHVEDEAATQGFIQIREVGSPPKIVTTGRAFTGELRGS